MVVDTTTVNESTEVVGRALERSRDLGLICERRLAGGGTPYEASGPKEMENRQGAKNMKKK